MQVKVRLTKLAAVSSPSCPTPEAASYKPGQYNGPVSLPVSYTTEGYLAGPVKVGQPVVLDRHVRNGLSSLGVMQTTPVKALTADGFVTENSRYLLEVISQFSSEPICASFSC